MPSLVRRFLIFAAVDGLVLQPKGNGHRNSGSSGLPSIQIAYKTQKISALPPSSVAANLNSEGAKLEAYGVVGKNDRLRLACSPIYENARRVMCLWLLGKKYSCDRLRDSERRLPFIPHLYHEARAGSADPGPPHLCRHRCCCDSVIFASRCGPCH